MLVALLLLVLAINGGLFAGTILYTAYNTARMNQLRSYAAKMWNIPALF